MDMTSVDPVRDELMKTNTAFRELVSQHQNYEKRLDELSHLSYPSDDEQVEENILKKKKLQVKDEIYALMEKHGSVH